MIAPGDPARAGEPVEVFVERSLYDPTHGFYETGGRAGRRGASFVTSPEVGPLFGAVLARAIDRWWDEAGRPDRWVVVDAGAGPATLARTILAAAPRCAAALELVCVERTAAQRALHPESVTSTGRLPVHAHVIVANELLDNLVFGILEETAAGWVPVEVRPDGSTSPDEGGRRVPVCAAACAWVDAARRTLDPRGRLVCFDYAARTAALAERPWAEWVRGFAGQEQVDPFVDAGSRDVTVVVPWDQLPTPATTSTQADWLARHGLGELVEQGRAHWAAHASAPDLRAMRMRSRIVEAEALTDPRGLGAFTVSEWGPTLG